VKNGLKLLVLGNRQDAAGYEAANDILQPFGMAISDHDIRQPEITPPGAGTISLTGNAGIIAGGNPLITTASQDVICSRVLYGKGSVTVFGDSQLFSNLYMGDVSQMPTDSQKRISEMYFWLMKDIVEK
jgi:hypothetical protein